MGRVNARKRLFLESNCVLFFFAIFIHQSQTLELYRQNKDLVWLRRMESEKPGLTGEKIEKTRGEREETDRQRQTDNQRQK